MVYGSSTEQHECFAIFLLCLISASAGTDLYYVLYCGPVKQAAVPLTELVKELRHTCFVKLSVCFV